MKKIMILMFVIFLSGGNVFAAGDLTVNGTVNVGSGGIRFLQDGTTQTTAAFQILSAGTAFPNANSFSITIPPTSGKINLTYTIVPSSDAEPIMLGFNDNLTATGSYVIYGIGAYQALAGKVLAGYGRTTSGSSGQFNSFDVIPSGNLILASGSHLSESNNPYWYLIFKGALKYESGQTITKINLKCSNGNTTIAKIDWKVIALP